MCAAPNVALERLAAAYGVAATLNAVADAIIERTQIADAVDQRPAVLEVVAIVILGDTLTTVRQGTMSEGLLADMTRAVEPYSPAMAAESLVTMVLTNVWTALQLDG
jgi:hypothetical protein